eukprot:TRINITY_DN41300_c0_g1_i4.p1 TRINITY_DN41300_c0_g1~~TRINITY_DN41300_c0_g1_i4.p1  ORF type:complete len:277 (-),score=37.35 TRINITY_DN41300_c0_g1_i4:135-965(-)
MDWFRARADELRSKADELKARATHSLGAGQFQVADRSVIQGQLLADGGFAYVYAGSDAVTGDKLAIRKQNLQDEESTQKARIELNLLESLVDHPHVVRFCGGEIVSVAASGGTRAAARQSITLFELCTGGTLLKKLEGAVAARAPKTFEAGAQQVCCPCFNNSEAIDVLRAGAAALAYLHRLGMVHYDVKSENMLLGADGLWKLGDFGSASELTWTWKDAPKSMMFEIQDFIHGRCTPIYRAPEMVDLYLRWPIGPKADVAAEPLRAFHSTILNST